MNALPKRQAFTNDVSSARGPAVRLIAENRETAAKAPAKFPQRPDLQALSESIPLFYICQNRHGFWIARDVKGRRGGLFLRRQSALAFARRESAPTGCAIMQLDAPIELDVENQGSRIAAPLLAALAGTMIVEWRKLVAEISAVLASGREHRAAAERELFHDRYWLSTKGDDDLPTV